MKNDNVLNQFFSDEEIQTGEVAETTETVENKEQTVPASEVVEEAGHVASEPTPTETTIEESKEEPKEEKAKETSEDKVEEKEDSLVAQADGQFSLFGDDAILSEPKEEEQPKKDEDDKKAKPKSSSSKSSAKTTGKASSKSKTGAKPTTSASKKKPQDIEVTDEWTIHYATHTFSVTDFVNPMPSSGKVKLEEIRQEMEKEFYEMTKERTKWDYNEDDKRLFPDVTGTSKGAL